MSEYHQNGNGREDTGSQGVSRRKVLECMTWAGTGVLWTIAGGVPESNAGVMQERFAVPPGDVDALMRAMRAVMACSPDDLVRLGDAGRAFAVEKYDIGPLMARILDHATGRLAPDDPARFVRA